MTREGLQRALIDLGWISLIQRALRGKPAETYALVQLMRCAGRPVSYGAIAAEYDLMMPGKTRSGSKIAIAKRIEHLRASLADLGCVGAVQTSDPFGGYFIAKDDIPRIQTALLFACGIELAEAA
jgi:hypothetical protein